MNESRKLRREFHAAASDNERVSHNNGDLKRALAVHAKAHPSPHAFNKLQRPCSPAAAAHRDQYRS